MITASAIPASREQTSPAPPRLLDVFQQAAARKRCQEPKNDFVASMCPK